VSVVPLPLGPVLGPPTRAVAWEQELEEMAALRAQWRAEREAEAARRADLKVVR
jgi:hypothetical protein